MKRMVRDGHVLAIPRPKDECYLYMPNPALIHTESMKLRHYLGLVDLYIDLGQPDIYEIEPNLDDSEYRPDAYARLPEPTIIEYQRTHTSHSRMQAKVDGFVNTYRAGKHDAKTIMIASYQDFKVEAPYGFTIKKRPL